MKSTSILKKKRRRNLVCCKLNGIRTKILFYLIWSCLRTLNSDRLSLQNIKQFPVSGNCLIFWITVTFKRRLNWIFYLRAVCFVNIYISSKSYENRLNQFWKKTDFLKINFLSQILYLPDFGELETNTFGLFIILFRKTCVTTFV